MQKAGSIFVWLIISVILALAVTLPISMQAHLVSAALLIGLMVFIKLFKLGGFWRLLLLAFGTAIVLRYAYWRTTSTLPPVDQWADFIPAILLYMAEMYCVVMLSLSLFVVSSPLPPRRPTKLTPGHAVPTVDVFVPSYNEDAALLAGTLAAAKGMDYPADKLTIWLLDDGSTLQKRESGKLEESLAAVKRHETLQKLCADLGVRYLTRERNEHAKAGNLNNGLEHSTGELIAVFDADHAPARDFLQQTVPHFSDDERLFLVQTPHFFLNPDPLERNLQTFETMPSENEMFYGVIQRGLDKWNAAFFCGSAAVLRRVALQESNGFSGSSITEDCETAIELHSRRWNSIYVDKPLIAGLQPATFASFIGQRSRWAQGMMQIMLFKFPLFKGGLTLAQRIAYLSSTMFWLFPFSRIMFLIAPFFYLFFDLQIFTASGGEFMAYTLTYLVVNLVMQNALYGSWRWPWISELYEYIQSVHLLPAVVSVLFNPTKPTFRVTAKDESVDRSRVSELGTPFYLIFLLLVVALGFTLFRLWAEPFKAEVTMVVGGWNFLNLVLAGCALGVVSERREARRSSRVAVNRRCQVLAADGTWLDGTIEDVSADGAGLRVNAQGTVFAKGSTTRLRFTPKSDIPDTELPLLIRSTKTVSGLLMLGCSYAPEKANDYRLIADLLYANSAQWQAQQRARHANPGVVGGTLRFLGIAFYQTSRGLAYRLRFREPKRGSRVVADEADIA